MGKYQNGLETQEKILDACRKMFYEKGYDNTTFADISRETGINQSAIHYHFKSKENLLQIIYRESLRKNNELVEFYSDRSTSSLAKFFFGGEIYLYKAAKDAKYRKFYLDAAGLLRTNADSFSVEQANILDFLRDAAEQDEEETQFNLMMIASMDQMVLLYMDSKIPEIDVGKLQSKVEKIYKRIFDVSDERFEEALRQQRILEERCKWEEIDTTLG